jgi:NAD(P)-dependent dehydrogenase (short-subunit alcohol dehydrogenase family)
MNLKTCLVTGANRGIGFEVCRQLAAKGFKVFLSARDTEKGNAAVAMLRSENLDVSFLKMDVTDEKSVQQAAADFKKENIQLNVLINNAGGNFDYGISPAHSNTNFIKQTLELNLMSAWYVCKEFLPLMLNSKSARIVNVSSGAGSYADPYFGLTTNKGTVASYGVSKLALNGLTVKLASELKDKNILVNSVCPGFTATYPEAKSQGARPVEKGAASVVWAAMIADNGPTGGFFRDGKTIRW